MQIQIKHWPSQSDLNKILEKNESVLLHQVDAYKGEKIERIIQKYQRSFSNILDKYSYEDKAKLSLMLYNEEAYLKQLGHLMQIGSVEETLYKVVSLFESLKRNNIDFEVTETVSQPFLCLINNEIQSYVCKPLLSSKELSIDMIEQLENQVKEEKLNRNCHIKLFIHVPFVEAGVVQRKNSFSESNRISSFFDWISLPESRQIIQNAQYKFFEVWS